MQNLFASIAVVTRSDEGLLLALVVKRDVFIIDGARDGVPIMHSPTMFLWVEDPTAAYVESMDRLGLLTGVVFDYGEDCYRVSQAMAVWAAGQRAAGSDPGASTATLLEAPF